MPVKPGYLLLVAGGGVFIWSGLKGLSVSSVFRQLAGGDAPSNAASANLPISGVTLSYGYGGLSTPVGGSSVPANTTATGSALGEAIADDAMQWAGHKYVYGGPSNPTNGWDCSSFVSWILGHDYGYTLPGGTWTDVTDSGTAHGPTTEQYLTWGEAHDIQQSQLAPGDLLCWETHIGFAVGNGNMFSALDTQLGTLETSISGNGPSGEVLICRRLNNV